MKTVGEIVKFLEEKAPSGTAESWDNVGLLLGDPSQKTAGAVISIDLTEESIEIALQNQFSLIINHHPCIFPKGRGPSRLISGSLIEKAIRLGISVAAYHTNFDQCALEVVEALSQRLQVTPKGRLLEKTSDALLKLVTFVPENYIEPVRSALCETGAGHIGNYNFCTFSTPGEGTFRGKEGTQPFIGEPGRLEKTREIRLETVFPRGMKSPILAALQKSHPYEEVAYDLFPVEQSASAQGLIRGLGYGFWGDFPSPRPFSEVSKDVKNLFNIRGFWITQPAPQTISRIGFVAGKGASFVEAASSIGCDLFITGEAGYHISTRGIDGCRRKMAVMEIGHRESEKLFVETLNNWLSTFGINSIEVHSPTQTIMF